MRGLFKLAEAAEHQNACRAGEECLLGSVDSHFSHLNLRFSVAICATLCNISSQFVFPSSILGCSKWVSNVECRPPHLSPNLYFNLQIKMPKLRSRSEMGLLNTLQLSDLASGRSTKSLESEQQIHLALFGDMPQVSERLKLHFF